MANLNFSAIPSRDPLADGVYTMVIEAAEEKVSSTNKPMILVRFKEEKSGVAVFENYVLTDNCLWKLKELLDALGVDTADSMDSADLCAMLPGQMIKCKVVQETYNDNIVNRIKKVYAC